MPSSEQEERSKGMTYSEQFSFPFQSPLRDAFEEFHALNPEIYEELVRQARALKAVGRERYGVKSLFEVIRWHRALTTSGDDLKLNNNHAPFYARLIMARERDLEGFFEIRAQRVEP